MQKAKDIDSYIKTFPVSTQKLLSQMRATIHKAAPKAKEIISYGMPAFAQEGTLVYFAGYDRHIGFYPTAGPIKAFQKEIAGYKSSKGAIQFPLDKALPLALITKMVIFRVRQNEEKAALKKKPGNGLAALLAAPAGRALEKKGIGSLQKLAKYSEKEIKELHGMGPATMKKLKEALKENALAFAKK